MPITVLLEELEPVTEQTIGIKALPDLDTAAEEEAALFADKSPEISRLIEMAVMTAAQESRAV